MQTICGTTEVAIGNEGQWACWHSNKTLQKQVVGHTWPEGYSLLTPAGEGRSGCRRPGASPVAQIVKNLPAM